MLVRIVASWVVKDVEESVGFEHAFAVKTMQNKRHREEIICCDILEMNRGEIEKLNWKFV